MAEASAAALHDAGYGVTLLLDRATATDPEFVMDASNEAVISALGTRVDGIPPATELAAIRVGMMTPTELLDGLDDRFQLLSESVITADSLAHRLDVVDERRGCTEPRSPPRPKVPVANSAGSANHRVLASRRATSPGADVRWPAATRIRPGIGLESCAPP